MYAYMHTIKGAKERLETESNAIYGDADMLSSQCIIMYIYNGEYIILHIM